MSIFNFGKPAKKSRAPRAAKSPEPSTNQTTIEIHKAATPAHAPAIRREETLMVPDSTISKLVLNGDLSGLSESEVVQYYTAFCQRIGLDPATQPFKLIKLNGKEVLYCDRGGAAQLVKLHSVTREITKSEVTTDGIFLVTCRAATPDGRFNDSIGAVSVQGLKGEALCNAMMKASTKAKRRAVLDLLGLGMLDESELEENTEPTGKLADKAVAEREKGRHKEAGLPAGSEKPVKTRARKDKQEDAGDPRTAPETHADTTQTATRPEAPADSPIGEVPWREIVMTPFPLEDYAGRKMGELSINELVYLKESWLDKYAEKLAVTKDETKKLIARGVKEGFSELLDIEKAKSSTKKAHGARASTDTSDGLTVYDGSKSPSFRTA